jgi:hypothetical protein
MLFEVVALRALNSGIDSFEILRGSGVTERTVRLPDGGNATAWYARGPWREWRTAAVPGGEILLASFGAEFVERAHETVIPLLARSGGERGAALTEAMRELRERLHAQLDVLGVRLGTDGPADVIVTPPGAESTSFNYAERRYMGLHIDQHEGLPLARRGQARRLCLVNVGWRHRYLYVYQYRVMDLCRAMGITPGGGDQEPGSREVTARYFAAHRNAGILRIRIEPGSGYLLNAQDLVHDGAAPPGDAPAVAFHSMGTLRTAAESRPPLPPSEPAMTSRGG